MKNISILLLILITFNSNALSDRYRQQYDLPKGNKSTIIFDEEFEIYNSNHMNLSDLERDEDIKIMFENKPIVKSSSRKFVRRFKNHLISYASKKDLTIVEKFCITDIDDMFDYSMYFKNILQFRFQRFFSLAIFDIELFGKTIRNSEKLYIFLVDISSAKTRTPVLVRQCK